MTAFNLDISVIICTRNRAASLSETLACLAKADRSGFEVETVVVDNGSDDDTPQVAQSFAHRLPIRYLFEARRGAYGKCQSLNRALDSGGLGKLVVVLDDDMNVEPGWWHGVSAISERSPTADVFTGHSYIVWPAGALPAWARDHRLRTFLFSIWSCGPKDQALKPGQFYGGGHFWFRSRVLTSGRRFEDTWLTEPKFMLQLVQEGFQGVSGPDASVGHRIQPHLLDPATALQRAELVGRSFAEVMLCPYRSFSPNARRARNHSLLARVGCAGLWLKWSWRCWQLRNVPQDAVCFTDKLLAVKSRAFFREVLRILWTSPDYQLRLVRGASSAQNGREGLPK